MSNTEKRTFIEKSEFEEKLIDGINNALYNKKMTPAQLIEKTNLAQSLISNVLNKKKFLSLYSVYKIAVALDISIDDLCDLQKAQAPKSNDTDMFNLIADIMDNDSKEWKINTNVSELIDSDENKEYEQKYSLAIYTKEQLFCSFVDKYNKAVQSGKLANEFDKSNNFAEKMKKHVLDEYIEKLKLIRGNHTKVFLNGYWNLSLEELRQSLSTEGNDSK